MKDIYFNIKNNISINHVYLVAWVALILVVFATIFARHPLGFFDEHIHYIRAVKEKQAVTLL